MFCLISPLLKADSLHFIEQVLYILQKYFTWNNNYNLWWILPTLESCITSTKSRVLSSYIIYTYNVIWQVLRLRVEKRDRKEMWAKSSLLLEKWLKRLHGSNKNNFSSEQWFWWGLNTCKSSNWQILILARANFCYTAKTNITVVFNIQLVLLSYMGKGREENLKDYTRNLFPYSFFYARGEMCSFLVWNVYKSVWKKEKLNYSVCNTY